MDVPKTLLSAGYVIRAMLLADEAVAERVQRIFPVAADTAVLPYILYRRSAMGQTPVKQQPGAGTAQIELCCFTEDYDEGVELAEAVKAALDGKQGEAEGVFMRSCHYEDGEEAWQDDAYVQQLVFNVKI